MGMFGTKAGMTQIFTPEGLSLPATVIALEDGNVVTQVHTMDKSGYNAVQVGYQECAERKITQPEAGHCKKAGANAMRHLREFKVGTPKHRTSFLLHIIPPLVAHNLQSGQAYIPSYPKMWRHCNVPKIQCVLNGLQCLQIPDVAGYEPGQALNVEDLFKVGDLVDVAGTSIGKGFQGIVPQVSFWGIHAVFATQIQLRGQQNLSTKSFQLTSTFYHSLNG